MSLDKVIREKAEKQLDEMMHAAHTPLAGIVATTPLTVTDLARLMSGHKTKVCRAQCVKALEQQITERAAAFFADEKNEES